MDLDALLACRGNAESFAKALKPGDISGLIALLPERNDDLRYCAFLALQARSRKYPDVYPFWDLFASTLGQKNSYQRNIALRLLAENVRWDTEQKFPALLPRWLEHCTDEKFVTSRQALQSIPTWAPFAPDLAETAAKHLLGIDLSAVRESQQKLLLTNILDALLALRPACSLPGLEEYFTAALNGGLLDKKTKQRFQNSLTDETTKRMG